MDAKNDTPTNVPTPFFFSLQEFPFPEIKFLQTTSNPHTQNLASGELQLQLHIFILFYLFYFKLLSTLVRHTKCCLKEPYLELKILD